MVASPNRPQRQSSANVKDIGSVPDISESLSLLLMRASARLRDRGSVSGSVGSDVRTLVTELCSKDGYGNGKVG